MRYTPVEHVESGDDFLVTVGQKTYGWHVVSVCRGDTDCAVVCVRDDNGKGFIFPETVILAAILAGAWEKLDL